MKIYTDTLPMQNRSNEIKVLRNDMQRNMDQIETLVLSLEGSWQGDAERAYASRILYVKKQFSNIESFFDDFSSLLENFALKYNEYDKQLSTKINLS